MLLNARSLISLISDKEYQVKLSGKLDVLQDDHWKSMFAVMTANLLYLFESEEAMGSAPLMLLIVEDCFVEMGDDNITGRPFSFLLKSKTTKRVFIFAAPDFKTLERWIHYLTVSSIDYIQATIQTMLASLSQQNSPDGSTSKQIVDNKE